MSLCPYDSYMSLVFSSKLHFCSISLWCPKYDFLFQHEKNFAYENFPLPMIDSWWNFVIWKFEAINLGGLIFRPIGKQIRLKPSGLYLVVLKYFNFGNHILKIKYLYFIMKSLHIKAILFLKYGSQNWHISRPPDINHLV